METNLMDSDLSLWNITDDPYTNSSNGTGGASCSEKTILGYPVLLNETVREVYFYVQVIVLLIGFPLSIALNSLVIFLITKHKSLQQMNFYLSLQVTIVDLFLTVIIFPTTIANVISNRWLFGKTACSGLGFISFSLRNMRNLLMFVFVTDRLLSVFTPFWYYRKNNRQYVIVPLSIAAWALGILSGIVTIIFGCVSYSRLAWGCTIANGCLYPKVCNAYKICTIVLSHIIGGWIPVIMYLILFWKSRKIRKLFPKYKLTFCDRNTTVAEEDTEKDKPKCSAVKRKEKTQQPVSTETHLNMANSSHNSHINTIKNKLKKGDRATVTFALLFLALAGISFPSILFFIIGQSAYFSARMKPPAVFNGITILFRFGYNLLVIIDPLTIMRNRDVIKALRESFQSLKFRLLKRARPVEATDYRGTRASSGVCVDLRNDSSSLSTSGVCADHSNTTLTLNGDVHSKTLNDPASEGVQPACEVSRSTNTDSDYFSSL